jgi:AraC-like DNA-binding protein
MDPDAYHPDQGRPADLALARCDGCQARLACLALALRAEDPEVRSGWYGGLGPADRDALAASLGLDEPEVVLVPDSATRAARLRAAGWTIGAIAAELGCSRRTVQRHLRKAA